MGLGLVKMDRQGGGSLYSGGFRFWASERVLTTSVGSILESPGMGMLLRVSWAVLEQTMC